MERMRADPAFRDVTSDSQNRGLQATLDIDRDKAGVLGVPIGDLRTALYNAYGDRQIGSIYAPSNTYQVILSAADRRPPVRGGHVAPVGAQQGRRAGAAVGLRDRQAHGRARPRSTTRASCRR